MTVSEIEFIHSLQIGFHQNLPHPVMYFLSPNIYLRLYFDRLSFFFLFYSLFRSFCFGIKIKGRFETCRCDWTTIQISGSLRNIGKQMSNLKVDNEKMYSIYQFQKLIHRQSTHRMNIEHITRLEVNVGTFVDVSFKDWSTIFYFIWLTNFHLLEL